MRQYSIANDPVVRCSEIISLKFSSLYESKAKKSSVYHLKIKPYNVPESSLYPELASAPVA
jgi:hypothetical protein